MRCNGWRCALIPLSFSFTACGPSGAEHANFSPASDDGFQIHEEAASFQPTRSHSMATAFFTDNAPKNTLTRYPWPVNVLSIGHTMASYQNYDLAPYFHHGIDIRADAGSDVLSPIGGTVVNIENYFPGMDAYWEVAVLDREGFLWQFHHIERSSIPQAIVAAYEDGTPISAGTKLGEVFYWGHVTFGERYHHIHLNILDARKNYLNPFLFLEKLPDNRPPQFVEVGILKNGRRWGSNEVSGNYSIYAQVHDLILHDQFVVPPRELRFSVDQGPWKSAWVFDSLPGGSSITNFVDDYFVESLTCGDYECRKLTANLGFQVNGNEFFTEAAGAHAVRLEAVDEVGNSTTVDFSWTVR